MRHLVDLRQQDGTGFIVRGIRPVEGHVSVGEAANAAIRHQHPQGRLALLLQAGILHGLQDLGRDLAGGRRLAHRLDSRRLDRLEFRGQDRRRARRQQGAVKPNLLGDQAAVDVLLAQPVEVAVAIVLLQRQLALGIKPLEHALKLVEVIGPLGLQLAVGVELLEGADLLSLGIDAVNPLLGAIGELDHLFFGPGRG